MMRTEWESYYQDGRRVVYRFHHVSPRRLAPNTSLPVYLSTFIERQIHCLTPEFGPLIEGWRRDKTVYSENKQLIVNENNSVTTPALTMTTTTSTLMMMMMMMMMLTLLWERPWEAAVQNSYFQAFDGVAVLSFPQLHVIGSSRSIWQMSSSPNPAFTHEGTMWWENLAKLSLAEDLLADFDVKLLGRNQQYSSHLW